MLREDIDDLDALPTFEEQHYVYLPDTERQRFRDAEIVTVDDKHVGKVERVITGERDRASHFLISEGVVFKHKKLVPASWIEGVTEDHVQLAVGADVLENLPDYQE